MKIVFPDNFVKSKSFLDLCNITQDYGFDGVEITDVEAEKECHADSIFRSSLTNDAKRKLFNRHIDIPVIRCNEQSLIKSIEYASLASISNVVIDLKDALDIERIKTVLTPAIELAKANNVNVLIETKGKLACTQKVLDIMSALGSANIRVCWDIRETYFVGGESADKTIQTLGAYVAYVRIGDMKNGKSVLIGEGELPVKDFISALRSLNYDGFISVMESDEVVSADIILTHFKSYIKAETKKNADKEIYYNRSKTGTFPWKKFDVVESTFSDVLDKMVEYYPDQYAFKYTTLDYTRTYSEFRDDVDKVAAALIASGVSAGHHVAIWSTNIPQWFLTFWATVKIGAVLVTVNTAYKIHEAKYLLRQWCSNRRFLQELRMQRECLK